jgi:threonine synthase
MAQIVYYVTAAVALGAPDRAIAFSVPSGNFGNVFAGYAARRMGLPIDRLIVGSNRNDVLTRFFETGTMSLGMVHPTLSPSMDIQISSNFERLLFELYDRDGAAVARLIQELRAERRFAVSAKALESARAVFAAARFDDAQTLRGIAETLAASGVLIDPHTAIGVLAARACRPASEVAVVALATADPAKFPDAIERAVGSKPAPPPMLADLFDREERQVSLPNDVDAIRNFINANARGTGR